jgi:hypothetical protein
MKKLFVALFAISILFAGTSSTNASPAQTIVVIDTGIDMTNNFVSNRVVGEVCILVQNTCPNGKNFMDGKGSATLDPKLVVNNGFYHGTAMTGIIVENSTANIIAIRIIGMEANGTRSVSNVSVMERAFQWVVDNKENYNIVEVSISQAIRTTSTCMSNKSIESSVAKLKGLGVPVIASSGNDSDYIRTSFPACLKDVISVGATDPATSKGEYPALYSNISDDFYTLGTMNTFSSSTAKSKTVGTSNATALFSSRWFKLDSSLSYQQKYDKIKSLAKVVSTAKVFNVLVVSQ